MEKSLVSVDPYKAFVDNYYTFLKKVNIIVTYFTLILPRSVDNLFFLIKTPRNERKH